MQKDFYTNKLYPLQDRVLEKISSTDNNFYLTAGTALSRCYLNHRYSEDLDFFVNDDNRYSAYIKNIQQVLSKFFNLEVIRKEERFTRFLIDNSEVQLKLEFINDVPFYLGEKNTFTLFKRVDNLSNILSNKITAIADRDEPKDFADILCIYEKNPINWELIFTASQSKAAGIFPPLIAKRIQEFDLEKMTILNWVNTPDFNSLTKLKEKIIFDILGIL